MRSVREARLTGTAAGGGRERLGRGEAARRRGECLWGMLWDSAPAGWDGSGDHQQGCQGCEVALAGSGGESSDVRENEAGGGKATMK